MYTSFIIGGIAVVVVLVLVFALYVKAPPSVAYILSGLRKQPRILIGKGSVRIPIIERLDKLFLGQVTVDVKTSAAVPTHDFIDVIVDAVCKVQVDQEFIQLAAKNFLNMSAEQISLEVKDSLEGNMREVIGAITLQNLVTDRDKFSDEIQSKAAKDMQKLGLKVISCNIQNIKDNNQLIENLGADNTYAIRKNAAITKANAEKDIAIAEQEARKAANDNRVVNETAIAERNTELSIKQSDLKIVSDTKKADADAAYEIQKQEQQKTINIKTVDAQATRQIRINERQKEINTLEVEAQVEKAKKEQELKEQEVAIKEKTLTAEIAKQAEADKYKKETDAAAELEQRKRKAEAEAYEAEQTAKAIRAKAEAELYAAQQQAEAIAAKGAAEAKASQAKYEAEAAGILAKGTAEAEAMEKKAEAYKKSDFAKLEMVTEMAKAVLPTMAENIAKPMGNIDNINIYGTNGSEASGISSNVPVIMQKTLDTLSNATGVDMRDIIKSDTIQAQTNRNINVENAETVVDVNK